MGCLDLSCPLTCNGRTLLPFSPHNLLVTSFPLEQPFFKNLLLCARHCVKHSHSGAHLTPQQPMETVSIISAFQMKRLRFKEIKQLLQGQSASKWWNQNSNPDLSDSKAYGLQCDPIQLLEVILDPSYSILWDPH